jgi:hypothetical protein
LFPILIISFFFGTTISDDKGSKGGKGGKNQKREKTESNKGKHKLTKDEGRRLRSQHHENIELMDEVINFDYRHRR